MRSSAWAASRSMRASFISTAAVYFAGRSAFSSALRASASASVTRSSPSRADSSISWRLRSISRAALSRSAVRSSSSRSSSPTSKCRTLVPFFTSDALGGHARDLEVVLVERRGRAQERRAGGGQGARHVHLQHQVAAGDRHRARRRRRARRRCRRPAPGPQPGEQPPSVSASASSRRSAGSRHGPPQRACRSPSPPRRPRRPPRLQPPRVTAGLAAVLPAAPAGPRRSRSIAARGASSAAGLRVGQHLDPRRQPRPQHGRVGLGQLDAHGEHPALGPRDRPGVRATGEMSRTVAGEACGRGRRPAPPRAGMPGAILPSSTSDQPGAHPPRARAGHPGHGHAHEHLVGLLQLAPLLRVVAHDAPCPRSVVAQGQGGDGLLGGRRPPAAASRWRCA